MGGTRARLLLVFNPCTREGRAGQGSAQRAASGTSTVPNHTLDVDSSSPQQSSMLLWRIISIALRSAADGSLHHGERVQKATRRSTQTHSARAASSSPCLDRRSPCRSRSGVPLPRALAPHPACSSSQGSSRPEVNFVFLLLLEFAELHALSKCLCKCRGSTVPFVGRSASSNLLSKCVQLQRFLLSGVTLRLGILGEV